MASMFKEFQLTFPKPVADFVRSQYSSSKCILEYGSGGSTVFAASQGKTIITTESSAQWLIELVGSCIEKDYQER